MTFSSFFADLACRGKVMVYSEDVYPVLKDGSDKKINRAKEKYGMHFSCWFIFIALGFIICLVVL